MTSKPLVFHTDAYGYLAAQLQASYRLAKGTLETKFFPDGEHYQNVKSTVAGEHVIVVGGTHDDRSTLELYDLASGVVEQGASQLTMVVPYFAYSTMERAAIDKPGEVIKAKTRARLLSSIPQAPHGNRIALLDLHTEQLPFYFEGGLRHLHVQGKSYVRETATELAAGRPFVLASTDAGRLKWVQALAKDLNIDAAAVLKKRRDDGTIGLVAIAAEVAGQVVIMYDDMIRTGGSLISAARAYKEAGAADIYAICTHGVLPGDSLTKLEASGLLKGVVSTDSHPRAQALKGTSSFLAVKPCGQLFIDALGFRSPQYH